MRFILLALVAFLLSGCMGGYIKVKDKKENETCYLVYFSLLRYTANATVNACGVTGSSDKSGSETQVISDILKVYPTPAKPFSLLREIK